MRVCLISHAYVEPSFLPAVEAFARQPGIQLTLITPRCFPRGSYTSRGEFLAVDPSFRVHALPIRFASRQGAFVYNHTSLLAAVDACQPHVILHEQEVFALSAGQVAFIASLRSIPLVMFVWENIARDLSLPRRRLRAFVLSRSTALIAGSTRSAGIHRAWGFVGPIDVIPQMGVAAVDPAPLFGRRNGRFLHVCYVGRLTACKGIESLIHAVARLRAQRIPVQCTIAGRGERLATLEGLVSSQNLTGTVVLAGGLQTPQVVQLLRQSDVLVLPSRRTGTWEEQFGRVLVEAMAQGTVTVGARTGAIPEVIGCESLLFNENDAAGLADILARLNADETFHRDRQRRLWNRARDLYLHESLAQKRVSFLKQVLTASAVHPAGAIC